MQSLNIDIINIYSPYTVWTKGDEYLFTTDYGIEYSVSFDDEDNFEFKSYWLNLTGVPEEMSGEPFVDLVGSKLFEVGRRLLYGLLLLGPHLEVLDTLQQRGLVLLYRFNGLLHLLGAADEPFAFRVSNACVAQYVVYGCVHEHRTILPHGGADVFIFFIFLIV